MLTIWTVGCIVVLYLALLFLLAFWGDKRLKDNQQHPVLYSLGLGVHCTSWAFYGTTTQASQYGWAFVPTYAGIILGMALLFPVILRISRLCQQHNVSSLADFIALRFQSSHTLAAIITLLSFIGVIPYIALQLDAITESINLITPGAEEGSGTVGLYVAALMALFAILFGTRTLNLTEKHPGLLLTIAMESLIKLAGLFVVGIFVCYSLFDGVLDLFAQAAVHQQGRNILYADGAPLVYISHVLLGTFSLFVLPRQFHMTFVECNGEEEMRAARWMFPLYLFGMTLFILPIALAGNMLLDTSSVKSDAFVLALPLQANNLPVSLAALIGGLSATTSMVIVATLALGIMIANNLITPLWLKIKLKQNPHNSMQANNILTIRRLTVLVVLSVAYWYHINVSQSAPLVKSGIIAIALLSQTFPVLLFAMYWRKSSRRAAQLALLAGFLCWVYWLLYPSIMSSYYFNPAPSDGQLGLGFVLSLLINCTVFVIVSWIAPSHEIHPRKPVGMLENTPELAVRIGDLVTLTERVLEPSMHRALLSQLSIDLSKQNASGYASRALLSRVEHLLAAQVGNPSSRILLTAIADTKQDTLPDLVDWVEEATQSFQFNHEILQSSVQNIQQGISVLDQQLCLLAWNERYVDLFAYPRGYLKAGIPIDSLLQYNAERGLFGKKEDFAIEIEKRIQYMREGSSYKYVRKQPDGRVIEMNGSPLPTGGYVTTYSDITEYVHIQDALKQAKDELEERVQTRTQELNLARMEAEKANESKTRFLAAAGHDLMQPFNAATLFAAMLANKTCGTELSEISRGLVNSLHSAESLLSMLLDMTKLESGILVPQITQVALDDILGPLVNEFNVIAAQKNLSLRYVKTSVVVRSDRKLLRRVLQNLLSNAIRYTSSGAILVGVRRLQLQQVSIMVCDTGPGIPEHLQSEIFKEFHQLESEQSHQGLGLGLTIVERISALLNHDISVHSQLGRGTVFCVEVPRAERLLHKSQPSVPFDDNSIANFMHDQCVLLLENDLQVMQAMQSLLCDWGAKVITATSFSQAKNKCPTPPDLILVDYHLGSGEVGTLATRRLRELWGKNVPGILNTANREDGVRDEAAEADLLYLPKPIKVAALKRMIKRQMRL